MKLIPSGYFVAPEVHGEVPTSRQGCPFRLYLCGPMTAKVAPNFNIEAFAQAAAKLRADGYEVFNPAENFGGDMTLNYVDYMREDMNALLNVDALVALEHWLIGVGSRVEVAVALSIGIPVHEYKDGTLTLLYAANEGRHALRQLIDTWTPECGKP